MIYKTVHKGKYFIMLKRGFEECKKDITILFDKLLESDSLRLTLSDEEDPTFLYRIILTRCDYEDLKKQQGLLIDFDNFPSQVSRLLQQCATNNMFLILQQISPIQFDFEVVEHNEFKRLVHLSLKTGPASDSDVKLHMSETIGELKKAISTIKCSSASAEIMWNEKRSKFEAKIHDLTVTLSKMEEDKLRHEKEFQDALKQEKDRLAQERLQWHKSADINVNNLLANSQENLSKKDKQIEDLNSHQKQLRDSINHLENQLSEKIQRCNLLEIEVQKTHIEVATLKAKNSTLEKDIIEKDTQIKHLNSKCAYIEKTLKDNAEEIRILNENLHTLKMDKSSLERRLSLSESLANKNNEAAHSTTEQLVKANQIISKQNNDLIEMKDKLLCRTAIALEQEKVIERNMKEIQDLRTEIEKTTKSLDNLKIELDTLKTKNNDIEQALKDRDETIKNNNMVIQWLHKKMEENGTSTDYNQSKSKSGIQSAASSTPYFLTKENQNTLSQESDESINFYSTSKSLNIDDTPEISKSIKKGLDPKYLKPASEDNKLQKKVSDNKPSAVQHKNGKENKKIELPKVDYREKKTARSTTTYRATPISAYFP